MGIPQWWFGQACKSLQSSSNDSVETGRSGRINSSYVWMDASNHVNTSTIQLFLSGWNKYILSAHVIHTGGKFGDVLRRMVDKSFFLVILEILRIAWKAQNNNCLKRGMKLETTEPETQTLYIVPKTVWDHLDNYKTDMVNTGISHYFFSNSIGIGASQWA